MKEHHVNDLNNFIAGWYFTDHAICDKLITYHENSNKHVGKNSEYGIIDESIKKV